MAMIGRGAAIAEVGPHRHELARLDRLRRLARGARLADERCASPARRDHLVGLGLLQLEPQVRADRQPERRDHRLGRRRAIDAAASDPTTVRLQPDSAMSRHATSSSRTAQEVAMNKVDLARCQFAMTSIYHFLFVPVTIGLSFLTALLQTAWHRTGRRGISATDEILRHAARSSISRSASSPGWSRNSSSGWTGRPTPASSANIFGAPLAMEGLAAFFLESTFLGLWIFGWGRLSQPAAPDDHLAGGARAACCQPRSSWRPIPGCSIPSATPSIPRRGQPAAHRHLGGADQPRLPMGIRARLARLGW